MLTLALVFITLAAIAAFCAVRLTRPVRVERPAEIGSMKAALERRIRDGAEFQL